MSIEYGSLQWRVKTLHSKLATKADVKRWQDLRNFDLDWTERTRLMAKFIPLTRVTEFADRRQIESMLDRNTCHETEFEALFTSAGFTCIDKTAWSTETGDERIFIFQNCTGASLKVFQECGFGLRREPANVVGFFSPKLVRSDEVKAPVYMEGAVLNTGITCLPVE